jgi:hypothetical protein
MREQGLQDPCLVLCVYFTINYKHFENNKQILIIKVSGTSKEFNSDLLQNFNSFNNYKKRMPINLNMYHIICTFQFVKNGPT